MAALLTGAQEPSVFTGQEALGPHGRYGWSGKEGICLSLLGTECHYPGCPVHSLVLSELFQVPLSF